jgi:tetratricopeptide (TPR) repeat protein
LRREVAKGEALRALKRPPAAILEYESAISLNPNLVPAYSGLASAKTFAGRAEEAFAPLEMAIRISPRDPSMNWIYALMGHAHEHLGQHEPAIEWSNKAVAIAPYWLAYVDMISAYGWTGQLDKAKDAIAQLNKLVPNYTVGYWLAGDWSDDPEFVAQIQRMAEGLRRAGMPE